MTGGSEKFMEKGDGFYFGEFKNLVCMVHTNEKSRVANLSEVSATPRAQSQQGAYAKYRLKCLRPDCHLPQLCASSRLSLPNKVPWTGISIG